MNDSSQSHLNLSFIIKWIIYMYLNWSRHCTQAKRMYEIKCKEKESAEEQYSTMSGIASNTKEVEKVC